MHGSPHLTVLDTTADKCCQSPSSSPRGTAAVSQLLGQAITIIQKIQDARAKVHGASDRLDGYQGKLDTLLITLQLVQDEDELQTPPIGRQVQKIVALG